MLGGASRFLALRLSNLNRRREARPGADGPNESATGLWFGRRTFVTAPCIPITMKVSGILTFMASSTRFAGLWDEFLSEGQVTLTQAQVRDRSGSSPGSVRVAVAEAQRRHLLFSPVRGLYVLIPPQYRHEGTVPADWFLDDLCRHLGRNYYLGYLSAAARHGAAHQAAQVTQTVVDRSVIDRTSGPTLRFYTDAQMRKWPVAMATGPTGSLRVATPETCAFDLAQAPGRGGGVGNVATVLRELTLDAGRLAEQTSQRSRAATRRLGFLLESVKSDVELSALEESAKGDRNRTLLNPKGGAHGAIDRRWKVIVNVAVEPDE
jgi:predicted transcriptional regulator of viral defense system